MPSSFRSIAWGYNDKYDRLEKIRPMIKDPNSVIVLGNDCSVYEKLSLRTTTKYPYCSPITRISDKIHDEVGSAMTNGADWYVIVAKGYSEFPAELLARGPYKEIGETEDYRLYERSINRIEN